jgi:hypothetical protein
MVGHETMKIRQWIVVVSACLAPWITSAEDAALLKFVQIETADLKIVGLANGHPLVKRLNLLTSDPNPERVRSGLASYLRQTTILPQPTPDAKRSIVEMNVDPQNARDLDNRRQRLIEALAPLMAKGDVYMFETTEHGVRFTAHASKFKEVSDIRIRHGYDFDFDVKHE